MPIHEPNAPYDLKTGYNPPNPPDPLGSTVYLEQMLSALSPSSQLTSILPSGWESPAVRALAAQMLDSPSEPAVLTLLHSMIEREVPMTGIAYSMAGSFFSPRIGCRVFPPGSFGVDFAGLCLSAT